MQEFPDVSNIAAYIFQPAVSQKIGNVIAGVDCQITKRKKEEKLQAEFFISNRHKTPPFQFCVFILSHYPVFFKMIFALVRKDNE